MRVLAHRGNRLHAPENTRTALLSAYTSGADALELDVQLSRDGELVVSHDASLERLAGEGKPIIDSDLGELRKLDVSRTFAPRGASEYRYKQPGRRGVRVETLGPLLDALPRDVPKLIELKHDSSLGTGRREEFVEATVAAINDRHMLSEVVLYSKDPDNLRLVRQLEPRALLCAFDWELEPKEQVELIRELRTDGLVIEIGHLLEGGHLTETAHELARLYADQGLAVGAVVYLYRDPAVFTREEFETLRSHPFVWSLATDSTIDVLEFTRSPGDFVSESFAGTETDTDLFALGYAKANSYGHVFQDDGVHVNIAEWDGDREPPSDPIERRLAELEERLWYAERSWPFYSGGGVGLVPGVSGDFVAEVDYDVSRVGEASTLEMAAVNVDPGAHQPPWNPDGTPRYPRTMRDKDSFFDPHGAPPFAGVEHDEADGYRINWNLGTEYDSNQYGRPCGDGTALAGRLRLERRGPWFSAYYRNDDAPDWVCVGAERNDSLNSRVFLRCAGKRWRQEREDDPSSYHPIVPVDFTFRNLLIQRL
jgi:glycerophosphoryl diester phosphodiesterase